MYYQPLIGQWAYKLLMSFLTGFKNYNNFKVNYMLSQVNPIDNGDFLSFNLCVIMFVL